MLSRAWEWFEDWAGGLRATLPLGPQGVLKRMAASAFPRGGPTPASFAWW